MNKKTICIAALIALGSLVGCANQKTQKQAAKEQWGRTRATVLLSLANDQYRSGNLDKSADTANQALAMDPTNVELHLLKARLQIEEGQLEGALGDLGIASRLAPEHAEIDYLTGVIHQRWQRPEQALQAYSAAARKKPDDIAYLMAQSEMLVSMDRHAEALKLLQARVVYFEHSAAIRDAIAQLHEQSGDLKQAVDFYRQASVLDGSDENIRERLAWALYRVGDYRDAYSQFNRLARDPANQKRIDLLTATAGCEAKLGMFAESRRHLELVVNLDVNATGAWLGIARTSLNLGDTRRAELSATKAVSLEPRSVETQLTLGYVRLRQGRHDDAIAAFKRANAANPSDVLSACMVGVALERSGQKHEAGGWYERAVKLDPKDELACKLLADARDF
jgi:tetratricopeptide (TPR) repeat protein